MRDELIVYYQSFDDCGLHWYSAFQNQLNIFSWNYDWKSFVVYSHSSSFLKVESEMFVHLAFHNNPSSVSWMKNISEH